MSITTAKRPLGYAVLFLFFCLSANVTQAGQAVHTKKKSTISFSWPAIHAHQLASRYCIPSKGFQSDNNGVGITSNHAIQIIKNYGDGGVDVTGAPNQKLVEGANQVLFLQCRFGGSNLISLFPIVAGQQQATDPPQKINGPVDLQGQKSIVSLTDVIFPSHLDGVDGPIADSQAATHPDFTGYPIIDIDGDLQTTKDQFQLAELSDQFQMVWRDKIIQQAGRIVTIERRWMIYEKQTNNMASNKQIIRYQMTTNKHKNKLKKKSTFRI